MLELKVLALIINELANLTIRRDRNYYRLQLTIKTKDINNNYLNYFIKNLDNRDRSNYLFNYDNSNERYYVYGSKVIELLELIQNIKVIDVFNNNLFVKQYKIMQNKDLFTRSSGKKLTEEELTRLEQLHKEFNNNLK